MRAAAFLLLLAATLAAQEPAAVRAAEPIRVNPILGAVVSGAGYKPLTADQRWELYVRQTYLNPGVPFRAFGSAAGDQAGNDPEQWGQGADAYFQRVANRAARFALSDTYQAIGAAFLRHEVRYIRCACAGFWPRLGHSLKMMALTYDRNGNWVPNYANIGGMIGGEYTGNLWMPPGYATHAQRWRNIGNQVGFSGIFNVVNEFTPEMKRLFRRR